MEIANPLYSVRLCEEVACADVHAARVPNHAVDDEQLLVHAHVDKRHAPGNPCMQEASDGNPRLREQPCGRRKKISCAHAVEQDTYRDPARVSPRQRVDEWQSGRISAEYVAAESNGSASAIDCAHHRGIGHVTVDEWFQAIARDE